MLQSWRMIHETCVLHPSVQNAPFHRGGEAEIMVMWVCVDIATWYVPVCFRRPHGMLYYSGTNHMGASPL